MIAPQDMSQERDNLELKVINYILFGNEKSIWYDNFLLPLVYYNCFSVFLLLV